MLWTNEEIQLLKDNPLLDSKQMAELLPNRTHESVLSKRRYLGLRFAGMRWEAWEIEVIKSEILMSDEEIHFRFLPHRNISAITDMRHSFRARKMAECEHCGDVFIIVNQQSSCSSCSASYHTRHNKTVNARFSQYKNSARKRGLKFELPLAFFEKGWNKLCHYCGESVQGIGIDRIDSSKGYTEDNVVICCRPCNEMKMTNTTEEWFERMIKITNRFKEGLI